MASDIQLHCWNGKREWWGLWQTRMIYNTWAGGTPKVRFLFCQPCSVTLWLCPFTHMRSLRGQRNMPLQTEPVFSHPCPNGPEFTSINCVGVFPGPRLPHTVVPTVASGWGMTNLGVGECLERPYPFKQPLATCGYWGLDMWLVWVGMCCK